VGDDAARCLSAFPSLPGVRYYGMSQRYCILVDPLCRSPFEGKTPHL